MTTSQLPKSVDEFVADIFQEIERMKNKKTGTLGERSHLIILHKIDKSEGIGLFDLYNFIITNSSDFYFGAHFNIDEYIPNNLIKHELIEKLNPESELYRLSEKGKQAYNRLKSKEYLLPINSIDE